MSTLDGFDWQCPIARSVWLQNSPRITSIRPGYTEMRDGARNMTKALAAVTLVPELSLGNYRGTRARAQNIASRRGDAWNELKQAGASIDTEDGDEFASPAKVVDVFSARPVHREQRVKVDMSNMPRLVGDTMLQRGHSNFDRCKFCLYVPSKRGPTFRGHLKTCKHGPRLCVCCGLVTSNLRSSMDARKETCFGPIECVWAFPIRLVQEWFGISGSERPPDDFAHAYMMDHVSGRGSSMLIDLE